MLLSTAMLFIKQIETVSSQIIFLLIWKLLSVKFFTFFFLFFSFIIRINSIKEYKILKAGETSCQLIEVEIESINHFPSKPNSTFRIEI